MNDVFNPEKRSKVMAAIRGRGNESTERAFASLLRSEGIVGWRRHVSIKIDAHLARKAYPELRLRRAPSKFVRPDFVFRVRKVAIFIDGCFWHCCPEHFNAPSNNADFWLRKISNNVERDRRVRLALRRAGWNVTRVWEHELTDSRAVVRRLRRWFPRSHPNQTSARGIKSPTAAKQVRNVRVPGD